MPQVVEPIRGTPEPAPNRVRWTRRQCEQLQEAGILTGRYELINGEILSKMGQKPLHTVVLTLLMERLVAIFGGLHVRIQSTIDAGGADPLRNEPEPDAAVTTQPATAFTGRHPGPEDLLLVAEVSDTTLSFDRTTKANLYALSNIREYWVLDVKGRQILIYRQPGPEGYLDITAYGPDESVATLAHPEASMRVGDLLP